MTEAEMVGWHHRLSKHEFEQAPGDGEGQGGLCAAVHGVTKRHDYATEQQQHCKQKARTSESINFFPLFSSFKKIFIF